MNDALIHEIVIRFRGGASMRRIAQSLRISRRTVKRGAGPDRAGSRRRFHAGTSPA